MLHNQFQKETYLV